MKRLVALAAGSVALLGGAVGPVSPASAQPVQKAGSGFGHCYAMQGYPTTHAFMGWCDGKGSDGKYGTYVICGGKLYKSSYVRSYGDRRGVYAACPYNGTIVGGYGFR